MDFLGNFFAEMGGMGAELFEMGWVQGVVRFFSYLGWALYGVRLVVACFEAGVEYSGGRGNLRETALNAIRGFFAVSLFAVLPVRLYTLAISLQGELTAGITGYGSGSIGEAAKDALADFSAVDSLSNTVTNSGKYMNQFNVYGDTVQVNDAGWEELSDAIYVKLLDVGETDTFTIEDGQIVEIHEPAQFSLEKCE